MFTADAPLREQRQLAPEQRVVVGGQAGSINPLLPADEGGKGIAHQGIGCGVFVPSERVLQRGEIGPRTKVGQEQEAVKNVLRQHTRRVEPGPLDQASHVHEGSNVFLWRRGIHHDEASRRALDAQVAPKARIGAGRAQGRHIEPVVGQRCQPAGERLTASGIGPRHAFVNGS